MRMACGSFCQRGELAGLAMPGIGLEWSLSGIPKLTSRARCVDDEERDNPLVPFFLLQPRLCRYLDVAN